MILAWLREPWPWDVSGPLIGLFVPLRYRIQEMFRFQSLYMYGILGSAMLTAPLGATPWARERACIDR